MNREICESYRQILTIFCNDFAKKTLELKRRNICNNKLIILNKMRMLLKFIWVFNNENMQYET
jgi:hypothetical protein